MGGGVWTLNNLGVMLNIIWYYQVQGLCRVDPTADHRNGRNDEDCVDSMADHRNGGMARLRDCVDSINVV